MGLHQDRARLARASSGAHGIWPFTGAGRSHIEATPADEIEAAAGLVLDDARLGACSRLLPPGTGSYQKSEDEEDLEEPAQDFSLGRISGCHEMQFLVLLNRTFRKRLELCPVASKAHRLNLDTPAT